jgi:dihydroxyacetone kinase-like protein
MILLSEIGGSMGPIYGTFFIDMANKGTPEEEITTEVFAKMLEASRDGLHEIIEARVGDKTLMDTLEPAVQALKAAVDAGESFPNALEAMRRSAELGMESTENMIANYGRSSRIGERSRGVLDAGATSCYLILTAFARGITEIDS